MKRTLPLLTVICLAAASGYGGYQLAQMRGEPVQQLRLEQTAKQTPTPAAPTEGLVATAPVLEPISKGALTESESNTAQVVKNSTDGLVFIETTGKNPEHPFMTPQEGLGSGFFATESGDIVTNYHVIAGASSVSVRLHNDPRSYEAEVIGSSPEHDLALLRIKDFPEDAGARALPLGDDGRLEVGLKAIALGAPFGLDFSVSEGIISSLQREAPVGVSHVDQPVIQTDAAINPGNSGGPLLNSSGQVIGVNTQILTGGVGQSSGVSFAIPISTVKSLLPQLQAGENIRTPLLGVSLFETEQLDPAMLREQGWEEGGLVVIKVHPGSPAAAAGLKSATADRSGRDVTADLIVAVNGVKVGSMSEFRAQMMKTRVGESVTLRILRGGQILELPVDLTDYQPSN